MAVIGAIRKRSVLLLIIIGGALLAFVLGDFLMPKGGGGASRKIEPVAEVYGEEISYMMLDEEVKERIELNKTRNPEYNPGGREMFSLRNQVYNELVQEQIYLEEYKELGLAIKQKGTKYPSISIAELRDMLYGVEVDPQIRQAFTNPETGAFNPADVENYIATINEKAPADIIQWNLFVQGIEKTRLVTKYNNLLKKTYYVPQAIAEAEFLETNQTVDFEFVAKSYSTIADSLITITDEDYEAYLEKYAAQYEVPTDMATLDYVVFSIKPSTADIRAIEEKAGNIYAEFRTTEDIESFVAVNSTENYDSTWFKKGELPFQVDSIMFAQEVGYTHGIYVEGDNYKMAKLVEETERPDSLRASHILIAYQGAMRANEQITRTREEAELYRDSLMDAINANPAQFEALASTINDAPEEKKKAGDLDWFADNSPMAPEFMNACLEGNVGDFKAVETAFGYHIIKVTGKKNINKKVRVAFITIPVEASTETDREVYTQAKKFANGVTDRQSFIEKVDEDDNINSSTIPIYKESYEVQGLTDSRDIIKWAFEETTDTGDVSKVFEYTDKYVFCALATRKSKGTPVLDEALKQQIKIHILREKKFEMIAKEINESGATSLADLSVKLSLPVDTVKGTTFAQHPSVKGSPEYGVVGRAFTMAKGQMSEPIMGTGFVFVITVTNRTDVQAPEDLSPAIMNQIRLYEQRVDSRSFPALQKASDVTDNRILWY